MTHSTSHTVATTVTAILLWLSSFGTITAQTFTEHLRQNSNGKATVTVTQSAEIEQLVNSRPAQTESQRLAAQKAQQKTEDKPAANIPHYSRLCRKCKPIFPFYSAGRGTPGP